MDMNKGVGIAQESGTESGGYKGRKLGTTLIASLIIYNLKKKNYC